MKNSAKIFLFIIFLWSWSLIADEELDRIQNDILHLKSFVKETDKLLHSKNKEYKSIITELKSIEDRLGVAEITLLHYKQKVKLDYDQLQKTWSTLIMQQADHERHAEYLLGKDVTLQSMKQKSFHLKATLQRATEVEKELSLSRKAYENTKSKSDILLALIQKLETEKVNVMGKLYVNKNKELKVENKIINKELESRLQKGQFSIDRQFLSPLPGYVKLEKSENGINFYYKNDSILIAPYHGKIAYVGELSSYGNVIMIEHDTKIMSVILGDLISDLKEESIVTQGSVLGKVLKDAEGGLKSVYYELRMEEKPIPTLSYLKI